MRSAAGVAARLPARAHESWAFGARWDQRTWLLRPAWQAGKLNGLGGKIEFGETPLDAMRREFYEEAGVDIAEWQEVLQLSGSDDAGSGVSWRGHFFRAFGNLDAPRATTDAQLERCDTAALPADIIPNLRWMIPLMLDDEPIAGAYRVELL
jgi:8-oxo-dGTP diphosphatase